MPDFQFNMQADCKLQMVRYIFKAVYLQGMQWQPNIQQSGIFQRFLNDLMTPMIMMHTIHCHLLNLPVGMHARLNLLTAASMVVVINVQCLSLQFVLTTIRHSMQ